MVKVTKKGLSNSMVSLIVMILLAVIIFFVFFFGLKSKFAGLAP
jgi:hypothetical protein